MLTPPAPHTLTMDTFITYVITPYTAAMAPPATAATARPPHTHQPTGRLLLLVERTTARPPPLGPPNPRGALLVVVDTPLAALSAPTPPPLDCRLSDTSCRLLVLLPPPLLLRRSSRGAEALFDGEEARGEFCCCGCWVLPPVTNQEPDAHPALPEDTSFLGGGLRGDSGVAGLPPPLLLPLLFTFWATVLFLVLPRPLAAATGTC